MLRTRAQVNLLWEAEIPLEVVAGKYLGRGEGLGLMGRGWLDINTLKKHYLSLTERSERIQQLRRQVRNYATRFNENMIFLKTVLHESIEKWSEQKRAVLSAPAFISCRVFFWKKHLYSQSKYKR